MTPRIAAVAFALMVLTSVCCVAAQGHGSAYVTTLPPGATVWLDGQYVGETPLFIDGLESGHHVILLTRSGWQPQSTAADITVGHVTTVSAVLNQNVGLRPSASPAKGTLRMRDSDGAKVSIDGAVVAQNFDAQSLPAGDHILVVVRGNQRIASSFHIYPDTTTTISLAPQSANAGQSSASEDLLAALQDYVPLSDFVVNGDDITIHYRGVELECSVGSLTYTMNGKPGTLSVAPAMVGDKPFLPVSLLNRLSGKS